MSMRAVSRSSSFNANNGRDSRSATPTLLRKASLNSLHSANGVAPPRRSTSGANLSPTTSRPPVSPDPSRPPPPTANGIARTHFRGELEQLHGHGQSVEETSALRAAETLVVLHDSCYGHRFSRPKTSRAALATIVERPERIKACVLGVAAAYVLLGERHADGDYAPHPSMNAAHIPSVPFRIQKSTRRLPLLSPAVTNVHGTKWMEELRVMCESAEGKLAMGGKELQRPEMSRGADQEQPAKLHEGDLYLCSESLEALEGSLGAVSDAVDAVFSEGGPKRAFVAVRPPGHHCSSSYPSGFCWVNNVHVGIMHAILGHGLTHAAIIDFDLHHGDGSQAITWQHNSRVVGLAKNAAYWKKASIGYYSLHDINSYPCEMGDEDKVKNASLCIDNAHGQHIWNVHLDSWKTEAEFWQLYEDKYAVLLDKARRYLKAQTERLRMANQTSKAAIFFSAGFDASEWEGAGMQRHSVNVPTSFYARIARDVTKIAEEEGTSCQGRVISVLEGGYSDRALTSGVLSHISGLAGSDPIPAVVNRLNGEPLEARAPFGDRRNSLELKLRPHAYDPSWWNSENLEMLESGVVISPPAPRAPRNFTPGNYSTPTHASTQKMVDIARLRRQSSMNGLAPPRPPTPPPPEVPWNVAAHGLCAVLTPAGRSTTSCRPDELTAEATRLRRERHMAAEGIVEAPVVPKAPAVPAAPSRMSLRERNRPKTYFEASDDDGASKHNRRKTVAGAAVLASEKVCHGLLFDCSACHERLCVVTGKARKEFVVLDATNANFAQSVPSRSSTPQLHDLPSSKQPGRRLSAAPTITESFNAGPMHPHRPQTSMTERPDTSMSVRTTATTTTNPPLVMKKVRTTGGARKDAPKAPRAKKPSGSATKGGSKPSSPSRAQTSRAPAGKAKVGDELENLTSGIKKITLVTSKQKEARARDTNKKLDDATKDQATNQSLSSELPVTPNQEITPQEVTLNPSGDTTLQPEPNKAQVKSHAAAPVTPTFDTSDGGSTSIHTPVGPPQPTEVSTPDVFIHYQPSGVEPEAVTPQGPLTWLPVNTSATPSPMKQPAPVQPKQEDPAPSTTKTTTRTPSPVQKVDLDRAAATPSPMRRGDLPVFTSTSQLKFAPRSAEQFSGSSAEHPIKQEVQRRLGEALWEVPETPQ